jgi:CIC family chloride channel protein
LSREYSLDPLEILFVKEVMRTHVVVLPSDRTLEEAYQIIRASPGVKGQHLFPVLNSEDELCGVVTRNQMAALYEKHPEQAAAIKLSEIATRDPLVAFADEPLRAVVNRMAESGYTRFPVLSQNGDGKIAGMVALNDLLRARTRNLEDERVRERVLKLRSPFWGGAKPGGDAPAEGTGLSD